MATTIATVLWQRLDVPGHDACRLERRAGGWRLAGRAVFAHAGEPCALDYALDCAADWPTRSATVAGWMGESKIEIEIVRTEAGDWLLNGARQLEPAGCLDLDLGFTPATNLLAIRRTALATGQEIEAPAAYLDFPRLALTRLAQSYRRTGETTYAYAAPAFGYRADLAVTPSGFVTDYPGLWQGTVSLHE